VASWQTLDVLIAEINTERWVCEEVGWIVYEDSNEIHLVGRRGMWEAPSTPEYGLYQRIPKAWIIKRKLVVA
jgi:hypothetical protein